MGARASLGERPRLPDFPDPDLENSGHAYYGTNYDRLLRVKAKYDPANFFHLHPELSP
jgi:hypothetical protein